MRNLQDCLNIAANSFELLLDDAIPTEDYIHCLLKVIEAVRNTGNDDIRSLQFTENVISTILADKVLIETRFHKEKDQVSMFSTLAVYIFCQREELPDHSRIYMDRVSALRKKINEYYGEEAQKFCGS